MGRFARAALFFWRPQVHGMTEISAAKYQPGLDAAEMQRHLRGSSLSHLHTVECQEKVFGKFGEPTGVRTLDLLIKSGCLAIFLYSVSVYGASN
jgi:hypothetical protein